MALSNSSPNSGIKRSLQLASVVGIAVAAYWAYGTFTAQKPQMASPAAVEVTAMTLEAQTVQLHKDLPSRTRAYKVADIRPQVTGIVTERLFEEGQPVSQGQPLYQINPAPYQAAYDSANAELNRAKTNAKLAQDKARRYAKLLKSKATSQQAFEDVAAQRDQAIAAVAVAEAGVEVAQINLNYTKVSAPISGNIGKSSVTPGALVTANQVSPLATITQLDPIYVDLSIPSRDLLTLRPQLEGGQKLRVSLYDEMSQSTYAQDGELQFSEVTVDQTTGTVLLRALFPNPDRALLPGMFVRAQLQFLPQEALLVPQSAAVRGGDGLLKVWVIGTDNTVHPQTIQAQKAVGNNWVVESGVEAGTRIVTQGFQHIRPGVTVKPTSSAAPSAAPQPNKAR